jgi:hypothetical protein
MRTDAGLEVSHECTYKALPSVACDAERLKEISVRSEEEENDATPQDLALSHPVTRYKDPSVIALPSVPLMCWYHLEPCISA